MKKLALLITVFCSVLSIFAQSHDEKLPIKFFENNNQWDAQVKYRAEIPSGFLFLKQNSLQFSFYDAEPINKIHDHHQNTGLGKQEETPSKIKAHSYEIEFIQANQNPQLKTAGKYPANFNYFLGKDKSRWASDVETFNQITYQNLYDNIDMKLFASVSNVTYEFLLAPYADANQIKLKYKYIDKISRKNGVLVLKTSVNEVRELKPYSYQLVNGKKVGLMNLLSKETRQLNEKELTILNTISELVGTAVKRSRFQQFDGNKNVSSDKTILKRVLSLKWKPSFHVLILPMVKLIKQVKH